MDIRQRLLAEVGARDAPHSLAGRLPDLPVVRAPGGPEIGPARGTMPLSMCRAAGGGERAPWAKLGGNDNRALVLEEGDTAVFSSRVIPGNERSVGRLQNALMARRVEVITDREADIHVSGHPARDELVRVYQWVRPKIALPVHGEIRHMVEHAALARGCQVPETVVAPNGTLVRLAPGPAEIVDQVHAGRLARDGDAAVPLEGVALEERRKLLWNGAATATLVIDGQGRPKADPVVSLRGIEDADGSLTEAVVAGLKECLADLSAAERRDDGQIEEAARKAVRRVVRAHLGKKPLTDVHIVRI